MKLRNKKTGEIDEFLFEVIKDRIDLYRRVEHSETKNIWHYNSLAELNDEWEDYEEPKVFWYIEGDGDIHSIRAELCDELEIHTMKQIGNYFDTREEAEKAAEKLKALKRLKDKGFSIYSWDYEFDMIDKPAQTIVLRATAVDAVDDLDLLFGGEK